MSVVFYSLSTLSNAILQGINRMKKPVYNAVFALVAHILLLLILMLAFDLNIYAVVLANAFFSLLMCILNGLAIRRYIDYQQEVKKTFVIPLLASAIMGVAVFGIYKLLMLAVKSNAVATVVSILAGAVVYGVCLLLLKGLCEEDLRAFPGGRLLVRAAKKLHLLR